MERKSEPRLRRFNDRELRALEQFERQLARGSSYRLANDLAMQMYALYLQGEDCIQIAHHYKGIELGSIVYAAIQGDWYKRREEYLRTLYNGATERAIQSQMEALVFVSDLLAVAHKQYGARFKRFIASGDEEELKDTIAISSIDQYRKAVSILTELTGKSAEEVSTIIKERLKELGADVPNEEVPSTATPEEARAHDLKSLVELTKERKLDPDSAAAVLRLISSEAAVVRR